MTIDEAIQLQETFMKEFRKSSKDNHKTADNRTIQLVVKE